MITTEHLPVEIDVTQGPCRGRTVVDQLQRTGPGPPTRTSPTDVDADRVHRSADRADRRVAVARIGQDSDPHGRVPLPAPARRVPAAQRAHGVPRLGAEPGRDRPAHRRRRPRARARRLRHLRGDGRRRRRATTTSSCSTARRCPTPARAGSRRACAARRGSSTRCASSGPTATSAPPGLHDAVIYELHVGTFSPEGTFEGAIPYLQELADLGVTALELMPVAEFPGAPRLGLRRRLPERDPVLLRRPAAASSSSSTPPTALGLAVAARRRPQPRRRLRHRGAAGLRPLLHAQARRRPGAPGSTSTTSSATPSASGSARAPRAGCATSTSTGCGWTRSTRSSTRAPSTSWPRSPAACTPPDPGALVIAESGLNDPKVMRVPELGGHGCDAAWADDFHHALRVLLTGDTGGWYAEFDSLALLAKAFKRPHVHDGTYSEFRKRRFGAPADRRAARALRRLLRRPRPGRKPRARRPSAGRDAPRSRPSARSCHPSRPCCSRARSTASGRRSSSSPTTSTPRSPTPPARAGGASSPPSPSSRAKRCPTRRTSRRSSAPS